MVFNLKISKITNESETVLCDIYISNPKYEFTMKIRTSNNMMYNQLLRKGGKLHPHKMPQQPLLQKKKKKNLFSKFNLLKLDNPSMKSIIQSSKIISRKSKVAINHLVTMLLFYNVGKFHKVSHISSRRLSFLANVALH